MNAVAANTQQLLPAEARPVCETIDYQALRMQLARAVRRVCPFWLSHRTEDIVQKGMMKLFGIANRQHGRSFNATYVRRVAYTTTVSEIRRHKATHEVQLDETAGERMENPRALTPETVVDGHRIGAYIADALAALSEDRRTAVTLYLQGYGVTELARKAGWKHKRAENLVYRGLADMRKHLRKAGVTPH